MNPNPEECISCHKSSEQVPLLSLKYMDKWIWICPQHLPILIHKPEQLANILPGTEYFEPSAGHPHP